MLISSRLPQIANLRTPRSVNRASTGQTTSSPEAPRDLLETSRTPVPLLLAPPVVKPKVDLSKPLELKRSDLDKPLKSKAWSAVLEAVEPGLKLSDLSKELFAADPAAANESTYKLSQIERNGLKEILLESSRELSSGEAVTSLKKWRSQDGDLGSDCFVRFTSDSLPTVQQLPEVVQNGWDEFFEGSPAKMLQGFEERHGSVGKLSKVDVFFGLGKRGYASVGCRIKTNDVDSYLRFGENEVRYSTTLKPEQMDSELLPKPIADAWENWSIGPAQVGERMVSKTGLKTGSLQVGIVESEFGAKLTLGMNLEDAEGETAGYVNRSFFKDKSGRPNVKHDFLKLEEKFQGQGIVKKVLRNSFSLYEDLNVDKVDLQASLEVGGYAWARYGWQVKDRSQQGITQTVKKRLETLEIDGKLKKQVTKLVEGDSPRKLWAISDMRMPVTKDGKETTLGKALLLGSSWAGTFDMDDAASMKRLENYIGKR